MTEEKEKVLINFRKAHSLLSRIIQMIENDEYCINIMQQNLAAIGLLKSANQMLMENHLGSCFRKAIDKENKKEKERMIQEILKVTNLYNK